MIALITHWVPMIGRKARAREAPLSLGDLLLRVSESRADQLLIRPQSDKESKYKERLSPYTTFHTVTPP